MFQELYDAFAAEAQVTGNPRKLIGAALTADVGYIGLRYDIPELAL